jgi:hypothetical protein
MPVRLWEKYEIDFIKENYSKYGAKYCSRYLNRSIRACQIKAKQIRVKFIREYRYEIIKLTKIIKESISKSECLRKLNLSTNCSGNFQTLDKYIKLYKLDISHFTHGFEKGENNLSFKNKIPLIDILVENSTYSNVNKLKIRLYNEGLKERKCELCGQGEEWNSMKISLILDHKNGIPDDHRFENLRIVCPNCNAGLETHCRGHNKIKNKNDNNSYCTCGNIKSKKSKKCLDCHNKEISLKQRKVERPSYEQLLSEIENSSYIATGKKYNVSDNAIRKWVKQYEKII